jgi:hypothetical protein
VRPGPGQHPQVANTSPMPQVDRHNPRPLSSSGQAIKETEAADHRGPDLAMHQEVSGEGSGVVQHQDAGRIPREEVLLRDVPPAYDSIMQYTRLRNVVAPCRGSYDAKQYVISLWISFCVLLGLFTCCTTSTGTGALRS